MPIAGKLDFSYAMNPANLTNFILVCCTFLFVDFFDTVGTIGLALGVLSYVVINLLYNFITPKEERKKVSVIMVVLAFLFVLKLIYL